MVESYADLAVRCPNSNCPFHSSPLSIQDATTRIQVPADPTRWPTKGLPLYVACPNCNLVSPHWKPMYRMFPIIDGQPPRSSRHEGKFWLRMSFRCAVLDCKTPAEFHVLVEDPFNEATTNELRDRLHQGYWCGALPCGHPISATSSQKVLIEIARGKMRGYNPNHPRWKRL